MLGMASCMRHANFYHYTTLQVDCGGVGVPLTVPAYFHECEGLSPETSYNITVTAANKAGVSPEATISVNTSCSPGFPGVEQGEEDVLTITLPGSCSVQ